MRARRDERVFMAASYHADYATVLATPMTSRQALRAARGGARGAVHRATEPGTSSTCAGSAMTIRALDALAAAFRAGPAEWP